MNKTTILIVEDEAIVAGDIQLQLQKLGYNPLPPTGSGERAVVLAKELRPDLVLMDIQLSGTLSGIVAAQIIREELSIPVVFLTAFADDDTLIRAKNTEPFGYILKPFREQDLRIAIEMAVFKSKAEAKLLASERRFRTIFNAEPECVIVLGASCSLHEINSAGLAILEAESAGEVRSRGILNFILPECRARFNDLYKAAIIGKKDLITFEITGLRGTRRWLEAHSAPLWDAEQGLTMMLCVIRDITERRQAEQTLRESERRLSGLIRSAMDAIITFDGEWNVVLFNPAAERIFRCTVGDVLGKSLHQFIPERFRVACDDHVRQFAGNGIPFLQLGTRTEIVGLRLDGEEFPAEASILQIDDSGKLFFTIILRDISERKRDSEALRESQSMLALILDSIPQGVFWKDRDSAYRGANRVVRLAMGYDSEESIVGKKDHDVASFSREQADFYVRTDSIVMESGEPQFDIQETMTLPDGSTICLETNKKPLHDPAGTVIGLLGTWQDITARKRTDDELLASRERLLILSRHLISAQEAERRRIAHELHDEIGQVFTAVSLHLQLVKSNIPTECSPLIDESLQIVGKAIQQVREMSLNMRPQMLDDFGLVATLQWFIERQRKHSGFEIFFDARIAGLELSADSKITCYRIVQEAITNIQRHAQAEHAWITYDESDVGVTLSVRDDGRGFDVIASEQRISRGHCLGLLGIRERVELLDGKCEIRSESGVGTTIHVFLPSQLNASES